MRVPGEEVVAFLDIGTNSVRLLLVRLNPNGSFAVITRQKEIVRLGEGEFPQQRLQPDAMRRATLVCRRFADMARHYRAREIVAVATSACREAKNQEQFLRRLRHEARLDVRVISGREEARLIYLGVASGLRLGERTTLFIDIGGGSTELIVGDQVQHRFLDTLKLGALRLTSLYFLPSEKGPVSGARYSLLQRHVRNTALRTLQRLRGSRIDLAVGSAGTIGCLADIAARMGAKRPVRRTSDVLSHSQLRQVVKLLRDLPLAERRNVPGLPAERADIIIGGAAILDTLMEDLELPAITVSDRGLRDGLFIDWLARKQDNRQARPASFRRQSVYQLGRAFGFAEAHAQQVARLALMLFDSAREAKLHKLGSWERELLEYAALLHDIGVALSFSNHHAHSAYFIRNADLLGFDQTEIALIAATAKFHRKQTPRRLDPELSELGARHRRAVRTLAALLVLAENLDRSHASVVTSARLRAPARGEVLLDIEAGRECDLELWGTRAQASAVERAFKRRLIVQTSSVKSAARRPESVRRAAQARPSRRG